MSYIVTAQPTVEPITLDEAKLHLRIDDDIEDSILLDYMRAARTHAERFTGLAFTEQTIRAVIAKDEEPKITWSKVSSDYTVELPLSPVLEILSVADKDGPVEYEADLISIPATLTPSKDVEQLVVTYKTSTVSMSPDVKIAILLILHQLYENRGDIPGFVDSTALVRAEEAYLRQSRVRLGMA